MRGESKKDLKGPSPLRFCSKGEKVMDLESKYQAKLIKKLKHLFPGSIVLKNDPNYIQGFPDLLILYKKKWAALETKRSENATHRPNQDYYVDKLNKMSFSAFIFPENEEEVLNELERSFKTRRSTRSV
jgi:hypothetical protein